MHWLMEMPTVGGKVIPAHAMLPDRADDLIGAKLAEWRGDFNETQPHTSLGFIKPADEGLDFSFWADTFPGQGHLTISLGQLRLDVCLTPLLLRALLS
jgi:hypothetical protein